MVEPESVLDTVQKAAQGILKADPYFTRIEVVTEQLGDIANQIQIALSKLGICAIVATPDTEFDSPDAPGPIMNPVKLIVEVVELVLMNRGKTGTGRSASAVAERAAWQLHYSNHAHYRQDPCMFIARRIRMVPDKTYLIYRVEFTTTGSLPGIIQET